MLEEISYAMILGKPLIFYLGILTVTGLLITAAIPVLNNRGIRIIPFNWHPRCAAVTICFAIIHGALGVLVYL